MKFELVLCMFYPPQSNLLGGTIQSSAGIRTDGAPSIQFFEGSFMSLIIFYIYSSKLETPTGEFERVTFPNRHARKTQKLSEEEVVQSAFEQTAAEEEATFTAKGGMKMFAMLISQKKTII